VKESAKRLNAGRKQRIDQAVIEVYARLIWLARTLRKDSRPSNGKSERREPNLPHQRDVAGIKMIEIIGYIAGTAVRCLAQRMRESIPD
jgi:hypothetical protein